MQPPLKQTNPFPAPENTGLFESHARQNWPEGRLLRGSKVYTQTMEAGSAVKRPLVRTRRSPSRAPNLHVRSWNPVSGPLLIPSFSQLIEDEVRHGLLSPRCVHQIKQDIDYLDKKESSYLYKCITLWVLLIATCLAIWWCFVHEVNAEIRHVQSTNSSTSQVPYNPYNHQHTRSIEDALTVARTSNSSNHRVQKASTANLVDILDQDVLDKGWSQKILTDRAEILAHAFSNRGSSFY